MMALSVCQLSQNRGTFDRTDVEVEGYLTSVRKRVSTVRRRRYVVAQLKDISDNCWVRLFDRGHDFFGIPWTGQPLQVTVTGEYYRKYFGFLHEIQPTSIQLQ